MNFGLYITTGKDQQQRALLKPARKHGCQPDRGRTFQDDPIALPGISQRRLYLCFADQEQIGQVSTQDRDRQRTIFHRSGQPIRQAADVMNATFYLRVSDKLQIKVLKAGGAEKTYMIEIGPRPVTTTPAAPAGAKPLGNGIPISQKQ